MSSKTQHILEQQLDVALHDIFTSCEQGQSPSSQLLEKAARLNDELLYLEEHSGDVLHG